MKLAAQVSIVVFGVIFFTGCGHHRDVRPGAKNTHSVTVKADDEAEGARDALRQANHYCKEFEKHAAILEENAKYTGDMDEASYKNMKKASKVAKTVSGSGIGSAGGVHGRRMRNMDPNAPSGPDLGEVTGLGGAVLDDVAGQGYTVSMRFKCE